MESHNQIGTGYANLFEKLNWFGQLFLNLRQF